MSSLLDIWVMFISVVLFTIGMLINGFIVLITCIDWVRNRKVSLVDFILTCLAFSRMSFLWITIAYILFPIIYESIFHSKTAFLSFNIVWTASNYSCMTCTTCLSVFYFLKISNFSHPTFLWMKQRLHKVLLAIVMCMIFYFLMFIVFAEKISDNFIQRWEKMENNLTNNFIETLNFFLSEYIFINIIIVIFFLLSLTLFILLIASLWSHSRRMKLQGVYSKDMSTEAHVRAIKTMISFLFFSIIYCFGNIMMLLTYCTVVPKIFAHVLVFLYPSGHPFLLILWNSKLKKAFLCVMKKLKCVCGHTISCSCDQI